MSSQEIIVFGVTNEAEGTAETNKQAQSVVDLSRKCNYNVEMQYIVQTSSYVSDTFIKYLHDKTAVVFTAYEHQNIIAAEVARVLPETKVIMFTAMQKEAIDAIESNSGNKVIYIQKGEDSNTFKVSLSEIIKAID